MKKILSIALLVSIIALMFSQLASVYAKPAATESLCSTYGVTPCLISGVTREDANYLNNVNFPFIHPKMLLGSLLFTRKAVYYLQER